MKRLHVTETDLKILHMALMGDSSLAIAARAVLDRPAPAPNLTGVPEHFHPVILEHGRELFNIVYSSGLGQHGMGLLAQHAPAGSPAHRHLTVVTGILNTLIETAVSLGGWTGEEVAACRSTLERVVDSRIIVPRPEGRIILDS